MRRLTVLWVLVLWCPAARGEDRGETRDEAPTTVIASGAAEEVFESPRAVEVVDRQALRTRACATTPEALDEQTALAMQMTSAAGGGPVLRGLGGRQVLLLLDGQRLSSTLSGLDSDLLLGSVDPFRIAEVEILRGPSSVLFGSDAMGGVVNLRTRRPRFNPRQAWDLSAEALGQFRSAELGAVGHGSVQGHLRSVGVRAAGSVKHRGDRRGGRLTGSQPFSAYDEGNLDVQAAYQPDESQALNLGYALVRRDNAMRPDRSTPQDFLRLTDQDHDRVDLRYTARRDSRALASVEAAVLFQSQRDLLERFRLALDRVEREEDRVSTLGARLVLSSELPYNRLTYGVDLSHDWIGSSADRETLSSPLRTPLHRGRYLDGSRYLQAGLFVVDRLAVLDRLAVDLGARVGLWNVGIPEDPEQRLQTVSSTRAAVVGSLHGRYLVGNGLNLLVGVSQGYRAPNVEDYSASGCSGQGYDLPNADLDAEKSVTAEAGVKLDLGGILRGEAFYAFTYLDDLIVRRPRRGSDGQAARVQCGTSSSGQPLLVDVMQRENLPSGMLHSVEARLDLSLGSRFELFAWVAWTWGEMSVDNSVKEPLGLVPPLSGLGGLRVRIPEVAGSAELVTRWAAPQDRLSSADRNDLRICPDGPTTCTGTDGYAILALRGSARLARPLRATVTLENLTNETYRAHGSALDGPGLSAVLGLELEVP